MKTFLLIIIVVASAFTSTVNSQSIIKCSDKTTYWIIPVDKSNYTIKLKGDIDLSRRHDILNVNNMALQYIITEKRLFTNGKNDDTTILLTYIDSESDFLLKKFNGQIDITTETLTTTTGQTVILWHYNLPKGKNKGVTAQLFADIIIDDKIFGLGAPLFIEQDFTTVKFFLLEAISSINKTNDPRNLCNK